MLISKESGIPWIKNLQKFQKRVLENLQENWFLDFLGQGRELFRI